MSVVAQSYKKNGLPGFPKSALLPNKKGARTSWKLKKGGHAEWDSERGKIEVYDNIGNHVGEFDPETGQQTKDGIPKRQPTYSMGPSNVSSLLQNIMELNRDLTVGETIIDIIAVLLAL